MKEIKVGLFRGRYDMPIDKFIFTSINDVMNLNRAEEIVKKWISENTDDNTKISLYVTGLPSATGVFLNACLENAISLSLMHFDMSDGEYKEQEII